MKSSLSLPLPTERCHTDKAHSLNLAFQVAFMQNFKYDFRVISDKLGGLYDMYLTPPGGSRATRSYN